MTTVLFVCVHNAGRSQMAAGFLRHWGGPSVTVLSAGTLPADAINPIAVAAMAEVGIDITSAAPELLVDEMVTEADFVITMGCGDACPYFPGRTYLDWALDDPAGKTLEEVRDIRNAIGDFVKDLVATIASESHSRS